MAGVYLVAVAPAPYAVIDHTQGTQSEKSRAKVARPLTAAEELSDVVRTRIGTSAREWLDRAADAIRAPLDREAFATAFTLAARRVGKAPCAPSPEEAARLRATGVTWQLAGSGLDELARGAFLLRAAFALPPSELLALTEECFQRGDSRERQAILRTLALLPDPARFVPLAVDACRTSVQPIFEAIACENPYPASYFPEPNLNQMVLKALFVGVSVRRILGLEGRITAELRRMVADYASERRAAGRSVPADIPYLLGENGSVS